MTAQEPRRARRRAVPAASLSRTVSPHPDDTAAPKRAASTGASTAHHRAHHVTRDYSHVHRDLMTILGVGVIVVAFIVAMSFLVS